jgi:hypothetical protein
MKDLDKKINRILSESELIGDRDVTEEIELPSSFSDTKDISSYTTGLRRVGLYARRANTPQKYAMMFQVVADLSKEFPSATKQIMIWKAVRDAFDMRFGAKYAPPPTED